MTMITTQVGRSWQTIIIDTIHQDFKILMNLYWIGLFQLVYFVGMANWRKYFGVSLRLYINTNSDILTPVQVNLQLRNVFRGKTPQDTQPFCWKRNIKKQKTAWLKTSLQPLHLKVPLQRNAMRCVIVCDINAKECSGNEGCQPIKPQLMVHYRGSQCSWVDRRRPGIDSEQTSKLKPQTGRKRSLHVRTKNSIRQPKRKCARHFTAFLVAVV